MGDLLARDLVLRQCIQDIQTITGLDETLCRQAVYTATDRFLAPDSFVEATEQLVILFEGTVSDGGTTR
jgi:hypothetical protein